jgi:VWFA-related protein
MLAGKKLENAKKALSQFLTRLRPGDEAMLITFRTRPKVVQDFTRQFDRLRKELRRLDGNGSTALYDAILAALVEAGRAQNQRRTLLLITDGLNTYGRAQLEETIERLRTEGMELFAIGLESDLPEDLQDKAVTRFILDQLTQSAGGESFTLGDSKRLGRICDTISDRIHNQYTFGYYPPPSTGQGWRSIRIVTRGTGLKVIPSKTGYYAARRISAKSR